MIFKQTCHFLDLDEFGVDLTEEILLNGVADELKALPKLSFGMIASGFSGKKPAARKSDTAFSGLKPLSTTIFIKLET